MGTSSPTKTSGTLAGVLCLARCGLSIFPIANGKKTPAIPSWEPYQSSAADEEQLRKWFQGSSKNTYAVVTGVISGIVVVDCDSPEAFDCAKERCPETPLMVQTARGVHLYFRSPGFKVCNRASINTANGKVEIDIRGDGGYVLGPGATHPSGCIYKVLTGGELLKSGSLLGLPIFDPAWFPTEAKKSIAPPAASRQESLDDVFNRAVLYAAKVPAPATGGRNDAANRLAFTLKHRFALCDADVLKIVEDWNLGCQPPLEDDELRRTCESAFSATCKDPGDLRDAPRNFPDKTKTDSVPASPKADRESSGVVVPESAVINPKSLTFARVHRKDLVLINADYPPVTVLTTALQSVNPPGRVPYLVNGPAGLSAVLEHSRRLVTIATAAEVSARLQDRLGFLKLTENKETGSITGRQVSPPKALCETALALKSEELGLPQVSFCSEVPKIAQDLSLVTKPGYHAKQRALYLPDPSLTLPDIPETPTTERVKEARRLIVEVFQDFPFITNSCRANAVALMIAPFVREATGISPLFLTWAPSRGTGKSLMVECAMIPFLGAIDQHDIPDNLALLNEFSEEHADRELASALLQSPDVAWLDNFNNRLASGIFAKLLTSGFYDHRILGTSGRRKMRNSPVWIATANAPRMSDEIARRVCYIGLDAKSERPEERTGFLHVDIKGWCVQNRARLIEAILVLIQHWIACGRPKGLTTFGSFQRWADVLGGILACAGITGFMENRREQLERSDDETEEWKTFTGGWWEKFGPDRVTCGELIELVRKTHLPSFVFGRPNEQSQIVCLGKSLNQKVGRIYGGFAIERGGVIRGSMRYNLASLAEDAPVKPDAVSIDFPEEEVLRP